MISTGNEGFDEDQGMDLLLSVYNNVYGAEVQVVVERRT